MVLAVLGGCVIVLAVIGLGFYAVGKMRPGSFRVRTTMMRVFSFSMEIESSGTPGPERSLEDGDSGDAEAPALTPSE